ncbi:hypothetical protein PENSPDRAFT_659873 [Peniophora sp. CONT]|nr:hypothetical protein PENSPDRAFT_659873 [Peniophora sp. CONT]
MTTAVKTPPWLAGPSERRLREISGVMTLGGPRSAGYAALIIEDAMALKQLAATFLRCANAYTSPIVRLSPELLFEIFSYVAELEPTNDEELGWIRLGHVSYAFRSALLSMRGLWASAIWDVALHALPEVHSRAGDIPLSIHLKNNFGEDVESERIEFAMENITKARRVKIEECNTNTNLWTLEPRNLAGRSFPHLEELDVQLLYQDGSSDDLDWLGTEVYRLEPMHAPRLRSVHLANVFVPFCPDNLTSLSLTRLKYHLDGTVAISADLLPSPEHFLDMLARCVNVRHLQLEDAIPDIASLDPPLRSSRAIELPSLKKLSLSASMSIVTALWSHFAPLPVEASITIRPDWTDYTRAVGGFVDPRRLSFLSLFMEHFARGSSSHVSALSIEAELYEENYATQCGFFKRASNPAVEEGQPIYLEDTGALGDIYVPFLDVWFSQCVWDAQISLSRLIESIPGLFLAGIETLDVMDVFRDDLRRLLARLPRLHTLYLRSPASSSLAILAVKQSGSSPATSTSETYLPGLRHLRVFDLSLCQDTAIHRNVPHFDEMVDILSSRRNAGIPIQSIHIANLRIYGNWEASDAFVERVRELVPGEVIVNKEVL